MTMQLLLVTCLTLLAATGEAQKSKTAGEIRLAVTVDDDSALRIQSDGGGVYIDGQVGVSARIDQYGNLIIDFGAPRKGTGRGVSFDYSCPFDSTDQLPACGPELADPPSGVHTRSYISTVCPTDGPCMDLQALPAGDQQCVQMNWQFIDGQGRTWRNGFHRNRDLPDQEGTAYAVVTRLSDTEWSVEPQAAACQAGSANVARVFQVESVKGRWVYSDSGLYWLPFRLLLNRID